MFFGEDSMKLRINSPGRGGRKLRLDVFVYDVLVVLVGIVDSELFGIRVLSSTRVQWSFISQTCVPVFFARRAFWALSVASYLSLATRPASTCNIYISTVPFQSKARKTSRVVRYKKANEEDQVKATYAASTLLLFAGGRPSLFTNRICFGVGSTTVDILPAPLPADHKLILHEEPGRELDKLAGLSVSGAESHLISSCTFLWSCYADKTDPAAVRVESEGGWKVEGKPGKAGIRSLVASKSKCEVSSSLELCWRSAW